MADSYRSYQVLTAPPWLQDENGAAWEAEFGGAKDDIQDRIRQGVLARFPDFSPEDGIAAIGRDRQLPRAPGETTAQYAARLKAAFSTWELAGSHTALLRQLKTQGFAPAVVVQDNGRYAMLDADNNPVFGLLGYSPAKGYPGWRFNDLRNDFFSQYAIIFPGPLPGSLLVTARAVFTGTTSAPAVWSTPWDDANYHTAVTRAIITIGGATPDLAVDSRTLTATGCTVLSSTAFTGYVDLVAWLTGSIPFCSPSASTISRLSLTVNKWRPSEEHYRGAIAIVDGKLWGWPKKKWGDPGLKWNKTTSVLIGP